uniref:Helicase ATP-binding domain-containing protein n=1 Tax=Fagus sylvatica TaxID=28930 RepID=A0A2N9I201_FAGSY
MENEGRVSGINGGGEDVRPPSYWLDACEDIPCDLMNDFSDFVPDTSVVTDSVDNISGNDFFGGIEHILDSIKNGSGLPIPEVTDTNTNIISTNSTPIGNGIPDCTFGDGWLQNANQNENEASGVSKIRAEEGLIVQSKEVVENNGNDKLVNGNGEQRLVPLSPREDGVLKLENKGGEWLRERGGIDSEERCSKRARLGNYKNEKCFSNRGQWQYHNKDRERCSNRKRLQRDWDEVDRRDRDNVRRRENYSCNRRDGRDRDWRDRDTKGYWERDRTGTNEIIFRLGSWESDRNKEGKVANDKNKECNGKDEVKPEEPKEKIPEEKARQYQLDVLEQAKNKNTIAFLETGAGKTLIAVLLIKSISNDLQRLNKKMLAVFLVPKVPLVYQQAEVIRERTGYQVGHYCGEMGQDFWDARRWQREFETKQVSFELSGFDKI